MLSDRKISLSDTDILLRPSLAFLFISSVLTVMTDNKLLVWTDGSTFQRLFLLTSARGHRGR